MDSEPDRARSTNALAPNPVPPGEERPRSSHPADEAETDTRTPTPADTAKIAFRDERLKEAVIEGVAVAAFFVAVAGALWYWIGASSENSFWMALLYAFWPWGLLAMFVGGLIQGTRGAMRLSQESDEQPIESVEAFVLAAGAMAVAAKGALTEAKEDGKDSLQFIVKAVVFIAAIVLLLLVFEPAILEDIKRWLDRNL